MPTMHDDARVLEDVAVFIRCNPGFKNMTFDDLQRMRNAQDDHMRARLKLCREGEKPQSQRLLDMVDRELQDKAEMSRQFDLRGAQLDNYIRAFQATREVLNLQDCSYQVVRSYSDWAGLLTTAFERRVAPLNDRLDAWEKVNTNHTNLLQALAKEFQCQALSAEHTLLTEEEWATEIRTHLWHQAAAGRDKLAEQAAEIAAGLKTIEHLQRSNTDQNIDRKQLREENDELRLKLAALESEANFNKSKIQDMRNQLEGGLNENLQLRARIKELETICTQTKSFDPSAAEKELAQARKAVGSFMDQVQDLPSAIDILSMRCAAAEADNARLRQAEIDIGGIGGTQANTSLKALAVISDLRAQTQDIERELGGFFGPRSYQPPAAALVRELLEKHRAVHHTLSTMRDNVRAVING